MKNACLTFNGEISSDLAYPLHTNTGHSLKGGTNGTAGTTLKSKTVRKRGTTGTAGTTGTSLRNEEYVL